MEVYWKIIFNTVKEKVIKKVMDEINLNFESDVKIERFQKYWKDPNKFCVEFKTLLSRTKSVQENIVHILIQCGVISSNWNLSLPEKELLFTYSFSGISDNLFNYNSLLWASFIIQEESNLV